MSAAGENFERYQVEEQNLSATGENFGFLSLKTTFRVFLGCVLWNFLVMSQFPGFFLVFLVEL